MNKDMERLIQKIRHRLGYDFSRDEIVAEMQRDGFSNEDIFLAYHAAIILDGDDA